MAHGRPGPEELVWDPECLDFDLNSSVFVISYVHECDAKALEKADKTARSFGSSIVRVAATNDLLSITNRKTPCIR